MNVNTSIRCAITGLGAWGPGFADWAELKNLLASGDTITDVIKPPKPQIIPANERRRAPLPVRAAVEVSSQAVAQSGKDIGEVACVFGSGLGDTEITDYMCQVLTTEEKQLSPTKFHNSVHNAAAGYWTISGHCMKAANSIAGYFETAGLAMLEAASQCVSQSEAVLVTLFDIPAHNTYRQIFTCDQPFAAAILLEPLQQAGTSAVAEISLDLAPAAEPSPATNAQLQHLFATNPSARILPLLEAIAHSQSTDFTLSLSQGSALNIQTVPAA